MTRACTCSRSEFAPRRRGVKPIGGKMEAAVDLSSLDSLRFISAEFGLAMYPGPYTCPPPPCPCVSVRRLGPGGVDLIARSELRKCCPP